MWWWCGLSVLCLLVSCADDTQQAYHTHWIEPGPSSGSQLHPTDERCLPRLPSLMPNHCRSLSPSASVTRHLGRLERHVPCSNYPKPSTSIQMCDSNLFFSWLVLVRIGDILVGDTNSHHAIIKPPLHDYSVPQHCHTGSPPRCYRWVSNARAIAAQSRSLLPACLLPACLLPPCLLPACLPVSCLPACLPPPSSM